MAVGGTPSSSCSNLIFFSAIVSPDCLCLALYTTPEGSSADVQAQDTSLNVFKYSHYYQRPTAQRCRPLLPQVNGALLLLRSMVDVLPHHTFPLLSFPPSHLQQKGGT